ncbi:potassium channel family protein [Nitriliruptor alkaliphilus]|uniref:potassium channel family protein n=1 Tax=Nitriliruptor alkaliphilus TaxID=427918 RepID=UPI000695BDF7|nr:potassium channel family protein [Nitriliruptor alkaliphilus]
MSVWMLPVGVLLLGTVTYDALSTTVVASSAGGPLTSRVARAVWSIVGRFARPGSVTMRLSGPVVVVLTVGTWLLLLWSGWALIFSSSPDAVVTFLDGEPADGWSRVYYAGFTIFTLGVGDVVPNGPPWQMLTGFAVASGLALTTLAITYFIPVVTAVTVRRAQANSIAGLGASPHEIVLRSWHEGSFRWVEAQLPRLAEQVLQTAERHLAYPILHYFHSASPRTDLAIQLHALDEAVTILEAGVTEPSRPHPQALAHFRHATTQLLDNLDLDLASARTPAAIDLAPLRDAGIPTVDDATFADQLDRLLEHRRRLSAFAAESVWYERSAG